MGRIARAFGMQLLIYDPYQGEVDIEEIGIRKVNTLAELMRESDFVTCHMKVTPETTGIVSREMISLMKPTAYFINASRGGDPGRAGAYRRTAGEEDCGSSL